jgi:hypothetical protein
MIRRLVLWLAMHLPENRYTPRLLGYGLKAKSGEPY